MFIEDKYNKFGYSEMYEWSELFKYNIVPFGRFVTFAENGKIKLANDNDFIIGVTTINSCCISDDPNEWQGKYLCNKYGDILLQDINKELFPIINKDYNPKLTYEKRSNRNEWVRVNLLGKCIVVDDGTLLAGSWCTIGKNGIAILANNQSINKYYVISRLTEDTIMIFFK